MNRIIITRHSRTTLLLMVVLFLAALVWGASQPAQAQWTQPDTSGNTNYPNGNVGIGTTAAPTSKLSLDGGASHSGLLDAYFKGTGGSSQQIFGVYAIESGGPTENGLLNLYSNGGTAKISLSAYAGGSTYFNANNVGIGTSSPNQALTVSGYYSGGFGSTMQVIGQASAGAAQNQLNITSTANTWGLILGQNNSGVASSLYHCANCAHIVNFNNAALVFGTNNTDRMRIDGSGNVGIGTTSPSITLEVRSQANAHNGIYMDTATAGYADTLAFKEAGTIKASIQHNPSVLGGALLFNTNGGSSPANTRMVIDASGNVGIGTTSPAHKLTLAGGWVATDNGYGLAAKDSAGIHRAVVYLDSSNNIQLGNTSFTPNVIFNNTGSVGINTPTPNAQYKLDVNGNTNITGALNATGAITGGTINATFQDVAEWVPALHSLPVGTVVVLNPKQSNQVMASTSAYDTRVAGVVSERPGLSLGEASKDKLLVATTGRVKVKVDATRAPIQVGDLLVTSDKEGVAMKSEPMMIQGRAFHAPGTLIGKALEPLEKGTGEILVLLSLQ